MRKRVAPRPCQARLQTVYVPSFDMSRDEIRAELERIRHPMRVAVDRAKNPFNVGAIIRTAHSFLPKEIILVGSEPWYERAAMGMQRYENIVEVDTSEAFVARAKSEGWKLVCFEKDAPRVVGLWEAELPEDAVLVFGNEDDGIADVVLEAAYEVVAIPMYGINHSYPIAISAGIGLCEWARRRYAGGRLVVPK